MTRSDEQGYSQYIASSEWAARRDLRKEIDGHRCQTCCHDGSTWRLEVHHKHYESFTNEDVEKDLITLCSQCHEAITDVIRSRRNDGRPVSVEEFVSRELTSRKEVHHGLEEVAVSDHLGRTADSSQRKSCEPVVAGG